jgi:hypothetical protein
MPPIQSRAAGAAFDTGASSKIVTGKVRSDRNTSRGVERPRQAEILYHPFRFIARRHPAARRELIDEKRQILAQSG